jgi:hypothetical protein
MKHIFGPLSRGGPAKNLCTKSEKLAHLESYLGLL